MPEQKLSKQKQEQGLPHCQWHMLLQGFFLDAQIRVTNVYFTKTNFRFTDSVIKALNGQEGVVECAYVQSEITEASFFATPILLVKEFTTVFKFSKSDKIYFRVKMALRRILDLARSTSSKATF